MSKILYYHQQSHFSRKIRILLIEKKIEHELKEIDLLNKPSEFTEISPIGKVPVFIDEDGTVIWDSTLIAEYIEDKYPNPCFYPSNSQDNLECRKCEEIADALGNTIVQLWIFNLINKSNSSPYSSSLGKSIKRLFDFFEQKLSKSQYILGSDNWTIADISALCSFGYYNLRFNEDWKLEYKAIKNWFEQLHEIESVRSTIPQPINR